VDAVIRLQRGDESDESSSLAVTVMNTKATGPPVAGCRLPFGSWQLAILDG
jgi:hypothetical protein